MSVLAWLDQFISALEPAFLQILNMSITASYVTLAVLLVRLLLRRLPKRYSYALWSVVAFRLVCPVSISSLLSIFNIGIFDMTAATKGAELIYVPGNIGTMQEPSVTVGIPYLNAAITESLPAPHACSKRQSPADLTVHRNSGLDFGAVGFGCLRCGFPCGALPPCARRGAHGGYRGRV